MIRYFLGIGILICILGTASCRNDFEFENSTGNLEFSKDTVFLDTVFTNIGSSTYSLKIYNRSDTDIQIPSVRLEQGQTSGYRLNVNGSAGKEFTNIPILAKDSIFVFIETTFDVSVVDENTFLYTDDLVFDSGILEQRVPLVTLVKDAIFLFPRQLSDGTTETVSLGQDGDGNTIELEGFFLEEDELVFTNEKPYVIYGYATVGENKTLVMEPGTRVHFHKDSGIIVGNGASLKVNGSLSTDQNILENEVIFEGDRLEPEFSDVPGQWGLIWMVRGSTGNEINYLTIKNATVGILVEGDGNLETPTLAIKNTQIYNSATVNLWGRTAFIEGENLVLGNAGSHSFYGNLGGAYSFAHCTIANYWNNSFRTDAALRIDNFVQTGATTALAADLTRAQFTNCIIDGNSAVELSLATNGANRFMYMFSHCLIKFNDSSNQFADNPLFNFNDETTYTNVLINGTTDFINTSRQDFRLQNTSDALDNGDAAAAQRVPLDILGTNRAPIPDVGAYELVPEN